jgi:hypothetical protein
LNLVGRASTWARFIAPIAAGTWIHGRHQLKSRGIGNSVSSARQSSLPGFHGLAQYFQAVTTKFWQFIQKQHPAVCQ